LAAKAIARAKAILLAIKRIVDELGGQTEVPGDEQFLGYTMWIPTAFGKLWLSPQYILDDAKGGDYRTRRAGAFIWLPMLVAETEEDGAWNFMYPGVHKSLKAKLNHYSGKYNLHVSCDNADDLTAPDFIQQFHSHIRRATHGGAAA